MLMVLEALVPCYLQKLKKNTVAMESACAARDEIAALAALATSLQALLYSVESLTRYTHTQTSLQALIYSVESLTRYIHGFTLTHAHHYRPYSTVWSL